MVISKRDWGRMAFAGEPEVSRSRMACRVLHMQVLEWLVKVPQHRGHCVQQCPAVPIFPEALSQRANSREKTTVVMMMMMMTTPPLEAQQRYFSYRAILVAILSRDTLQNGVSHRCVCVKLSAKGGYRTTLGECQPSLKSIARYGVS